MAVLVQYVGTSWVADTVDVDVSGSDITYSGFDAQTSGFTAGMASDPVLRSYPSAAATSASLAVSNNNYFQFTLTPDAGKQIDLTSFTMDITRGGASTPRGYVLRSSIDSYAADIATADINQQVYVWMSVSVDLSGASYQDLTSAVSFRLYNYTPAGVSILLDNITINGTVSASGGSPPTLSTTSITSITSSTASSGGTITSDGGATITARGVCWNTTGTPTISDSKTID